MSNENIFSLYLIWILVSFVFFILFSKSKILTEEVFGNIVFSIMFPVAIMLCLSKINFKIRITKKPAI